ncbi:hypothetical protein F511_30575 [Dorcoceras hygrometricum]|uniref:Triacylglycerol lipase n=1 Tax=Dorcoceras hygrometricum TaxID=472368 RepID=A0A2Z7CJ32_9LAMI|nr:hypothetical protein F511_30575 [Dorcoceras hygrometricum]
MGPISNIGPKTSWAARDRPEQYLEEISRRNAAGRLAGRRLSPTNRVRHSAARWPHDARPGRANSGASHRERAPIRAHWLRTTTQRLCMATGHVRPPCVASAHAMSPQPVSGLRNHNFGLSHLIMVKRLATSPHDPIGITDSACKNQLVVVSVQYGPFNTYIPIRSTTIDKSRVARDPTAMHTSWRSNSDITSLLVRTNQYNQDLGLIHSTIGNHLESPNEGSSIDHQVTIHLHAQNITMFPTNETWYFTSQMLVSSSGDLILILTAQSTRNEFRIHSDY